MQHSLVPLHHYQQFLDDCASVLNEEWKRSHTARVHSLEKSRDNFPINLILLQNKPGEDLILIGHSRLSVITGQPKCCLVESVVVGKSFRGKGYGRTLMQMTEDFACSQGYETMYLTTHDKQDFYRHLGYEFCLPVVTVGATDILPDYLVQKLTGSLNINNSCVSSNSNVDKNSCDKVSPQNTVHNDNTSERLETEKCNANKVTTPPPPPPPPCPAAPPPLVKSSATKDNISRFDPRSISWMRKSMSS